SKAEVKLLRTTTLNQSRVDIIDRKQTGPLAWMLVDLALSTGLRVSEIAGIKKEHIDFKRGLIKVTRLKRRKATKESLAVSPRLRKHLKRYIKRSGRKTGPLFIGQRGALSSAGLQQAWKAAIHKAGLPVELSIHSARHTMAFHLLKKTKNLRQVQKQLGHSNPAVTAAMYADVDFEDMQAGVTGLYE
ncbi:MAG: site-specific integrase, partial [Gammaproteobacteria bacterium]|nr:site-specific integrase [Gammaproteobacteria bacterium]